VAGRGEMLTQQARSANECNVCHGCCRPAAEVLLRQPRLCSPPESGIGGIGRLEFGGQCASVFENESVRERRIPVEAKRFPCHPRSPPRTAGRAACAKVSVGRKDNAGVTNISASPEAAFSQRCCLSHARPQQRDVCPHARAEQQFVPCLPPLPSRPRRLPGGRVEWCRWRGRDEVQGWQMAGAA